MVTTLVIILVMVVVMVMVRLKLGAMMAALNQFKNQTGLLEESSVRSGSFQLLLWVSPPSSSP